MRHAACLSLFLTALVACGERALPQINDDGGSPVADSGAPSGRDAFQSDVDPWQPPLPASGCVVAIRVDDCCTVPMPAPVQQVKADPCLVVWPAGTVPAVCKAKWSKDCAYIDCAYAPPVSRVARSVPGGTCDWADECATTADCIPTRNTRRCCDCPTAYPKVLVDQDPCLCNMLLNMPCPAECADCSTVKCKTCTTIPQVSCVPSSQDPKVNVCIPPGY